MIDFKKFLAIAIKDVRLLFMDRSALMILILTPIAMTAVIGAAFSQLVGSGGNVPFKNIPVAVVNEDKGSPLGNFGNTIQQLLVPGPSDTPDPSNTLRTLLAASVMTRDEAMTQVNQGKLVAALIIPPDFSQALTSGGSAQGTLTLYRDSGSPISGGVVSGVVRSIADGLASGSVAVSAASKVNPVLLLQAQPLAQEVGEKLQSEPPIKVVSENVVGQPNDFSSFDALQYYAPSLAILFLTFTMAGGATSIIEEKDSWTLQRLLSSPTSRITVLAGKLGGTYASGFLQMAILIAATALLGPIMGSKSGVWGSNLPGILLLLICTVAAATGLGTLLAAAARTASQADIYSRAVLMLLGIAGGAFFPVSMLGPAVQSVSKVTLNYWAVSGFSMLAQGKSIADIAPNLIALLVIFAACFGIGLVLFNRRLEA